MALGTAHTLDDALKAANTNWLQRDYDLSLRALTAVLGAALSIDVANVWEVQDSVAARVPKRTLIPLTRGRP